MLVYDKNETEGSLGIETKAYYDYDKLSLNIVQSLHRGPEVIAHSSINLTPLQFSEMVSAVSELHIKYFMKNYEAE